jgi:hypothetical protein
MKQQPYLKLQSLLSATECVLVDLVLDLLHHEIFKQ